MIKFKDVFYLSAIDGITYKDRKHDLHPEEAPILLEEVIRLARLISETIVSEMSLENQVDSLLKDSLYKDIFLKKMGMSKFWWEPLLLEEFITLTVAFAAHNTITRTRASLETDFGVSKWSPKERCSRQELLTYISRKG